VSTEELREQAIAASFEHFDEDERHLGKCILVEDLAPLFAAVRAEGIAEGRAEGAREALEQAAKEFFLQRTGGQDYNGYTVSRLLRARAAGGES
jgi:hypothetical protein